MSKLPYTVIKSEEQYYKYCEILEELVFGDESGEREDEIELLTLLINTWDEQHRPASKPDPVELIRSLMKEHKLKQDELAQIAGVGKSYISEILNYKKRMSKKVIRNIADHFSIRQSALNKEYRLADENQFQSSSLERV